MKSESLFSGEKIRKNIITICCLLNSQRMLKVMPVTVFIICIRTERPGQTVDSDEMPQKAANGQGLYCLPYIQQYFRHINR